MQNTSANINATLFFIHLVWALLAMIHAITFMQKYNISLDGDEFSMNRSRYYTLRLVYQAIILIISIVLHFFTNPYFTAMFFFHTLNLMFIYVWG